MSIVTQAPTKLRSSPMDINKVDSSPSQTMEEQIDAPSNSPTLQLNGLQAEIVRAISHSMQERIQSFIK